MASPMWPLKNKALNSSKLQWCKAWLKNATFYIQRPVIYFCFGLPMLAPAICLVLLSTTEDNYASFLAIGSILLTMGTFSVIVGIMLGVRDLRKNNHPKDTKKERVPELVSSSSLPLSELANTSQVSPRNHSRNVSPSTSSRRSSNSSVKTTSNINVTNIDKAKLVKINRKRGGRRGNRGMKLPAERLPPLTEEESFVKSLSRGNTSTNLKIEHLTITESNRKHRPNGGSHSIEELKDYLNVLGLGATHPDNNKTSRSLDENECHGQNAHASSKRVLQIARNDVGSPTNSLKYPTLVTTSHERTGIRLP